MSVRTGFDRAPVVARRNRNSVDAVHDALVVGSRAVWIRGGDVARHDDGIADGRSVEIVNGQLFGQIADARGHQGAIGEIRQDAHRNFAAADFGNPRRNRLTYRVDQVCAHGVAGIYEQVNRERSLAAGKRKPADLDVANAPAPLAKARMNGVSSREQLVRCSLDTRGRRPGIGNIRDVDLSCQQRFVAASLEATIAARQRSGKTQARNDRWLLDDHGCQAAGTIDNEVGRNCEGQTEHADDVFDDPVRGRGQQHVAAFPQHGGVVGRQQATLLQPLDALSDVQPVEPGYQGVVHVSSLSCSIAPRGSMLNASRE